MSWEVLALRLNPLIIIIIIIFCHFHGVQPLTFLSSCFQARPVAVVQRTTWAAPGDALLCSVSCSQGSPQLLPSRCMNMTVRLSSLRSADHGADCCSRLPCGIRLRSPSVGLWFKSWASPGLPPFFILLSLLSCCFLFVYFIFLPGNSFLINHPRTNPHLRAYVQSYWYAPVCPW